MPYLSGNRGKNKKNAGHLLFGSTKEWCNSLTIINVDEDKNKKIAEKYEATGSALYLTKIVGGKESKNDMTDFAFSYARNNPDKFISGLKDKINELLK